MAAPTITIEYWFRTVVYPASDLKGQWIAHGLETDVVTQGDSPEHAIAMMTDALDTLARYNVARGLAPVPLRPAPNEVWDLVADARPAAVTPRIVARAGRVSVPSSTPRGTWPLFAWVSDKPPARAHAR
jgi:hypothetical protein